MKKKALVIGGIAVTAAPGGRMGLGADRRPGSAGFGPPFMQPGLRHGPGNDGAAWVTA